MRIIRKDFWGVKINLLPCEYHFHDGQHRASTHKESDDVGEEEFVHLVWFFLGWGLAVEFNARHYSNMRLWFCGHFPPLAGINIGFWGHVVVTSQIEIKLNGYFTA